MSELSFLLIGLFLPLFPLSMLFNLLYARVRNRIVRVVLLLAWPQLGLLLLDTFAVQAPAWLMHWALATALLYGVRALALREVGLWTCFLASSAWALLWIAVQAQADAVQLVYFALGLSAPLALLALLGAELEQRFGAAYTGLNSGLAQRIPRFSAVLVFVILAIMATPLFPGFFVLLATILLTAPGAPFIAVGVGITWLLWSWAGARLLQGLIVGTGDEARVADLSLAGTWGYALLLGLLLIAGVYSVGALV